MTHPTDDELEAMAQWHDTIAETAASTVHAETAAMLRAFKGGAQCCMCGKKGLSTAEGDGGPECQLNDDRWTCSSECYAKAVDEPAPDARQEGWRAGIEAGIVELRTYAPHQDGTGPEHDIGYAAGYHTAINRLLALAEKGARDE